MTATARILLTLLFLVVATPLRADDPPITLDIYPRFSGRPPVVVRFTSWVAQHPDNRVVCWIISAVEGHYETGSCVDHVGEDAARRLQREYTIHAGGEMVARAILHRTNGKQFASPLIEFSILTR